jgi:Glycosyltransferase
MEIDYLTGPKTDKIFGMAKYQNEICKRITDVKFNIIDYDSLTCLFERKYKSIFPQNSSHNSNSSNEMLSKKLIKHVIFNRTLNTGKNISDNIDRYLYSNLIKREIKKDNVKHITSQQFAYLLKSLKLDKTIITCYDLIPWAYENNRSSFWKNNIEGLSKADKIITISDFSKNEIIKYAGYSPDKIEIVYPAVDHNIYYKTRDKSILKRLNISDSCKIILYVGSEEPRQSVDLLIKAFSELKKQLPEIKLIKIGNPHLYGAREKILELIEKLNLQKDIIFRDYVPEEELPKWYNAADLMVYPCLYAGFGMPPLEAMACGTPVITSNTTSLPEVVGDAGIMIDPQDINTLANNMYNVLTNDGLKEDMSKKGLKRAELFNWNESAAKTKDIYKELD